MKINAVIKANRIKISDIEMKKIAIYLAGACLAAGIVSGCSFYVLFSEKIKGELWEFFINFTTDFYGKSKPEILSGLLLSSIPYLILMYFSGTNIKGTVLSLIFTYAKSFGLGLLSSYIFCTYALKGIEFCLLILFPGKIILIFAMLLLTKNCFNTSYDVRSSVKDKSSSKAIISNYDLRTALISLLVIFSNLVDFITVICFSSLFSFS